MAKAFQWINRWLLHQWTSWAHQKLRLYRRIFWWCHDFILFLVGDIRANLILLVMWQHTVLLLLRAPIELILMAFTCNFIDWQLPLFIEHVVIRILESFFELFHLHMLFIAMIYDVLSNHWVCQHCLVTIRGGIHWIVGDIAINICLRHDKTFWLTCNVCIHVHIETSRCGT